MWLIPFGCFWPSTSINMLHHIEIEMLQLCTSLANTVTMSRCLTTYDNILLSYASCIKHVRKDANHIATFTKSLENLCYSVVLC